MKLGKLLAAGKSIMKGQAEISYRSSRQIYLPKFNSANPFKADASAQPDEITAAAATARPASDAATATNADTHSPTVKATDAPPSSSKNSPAIRGWLAPSHNPKSPEETAEKPRVTTTTANSGPANSQSVISNRKSHIAVSPSKKSENASTFQRFNALLRSALGKASPFDKSAKNQKGTATQTELSLDSIKVVHNDLSDVDVEVVPIKSRSGAPELAAPKNSWEYVGERLFGVEAT